MQHRRAIGRLADLLRRQQTFGSTPDVKFAVAHAQLFPVLPLEHMAHYCVPGTRKKRQECFEPLNLPIPAGQAPPSPLMGATTYLPLAIATFGRGGARRRTARHQVGFTV
jgi:hypothetical protein